MNIDRSRADYGERRIVTVLFCDVVGSTAMAEQLDPENWIEIINDAFEYLISAVHRYGGTVSQLRGDGLLALFGAPEAHEDDPDRAVLSKAAATSAAGQHEDALTLLASLETGGDLISCEESLLKGSILAAMDNSRDADDAFLAARKCGERYGPRGKLWQIAARRATLWAGVDQDVVESELAIAEHELDKIARSISDSSQRETFPTAARRLMP